MAKKKGNKILTYVLIAAGVLLGIGLLILLITSNVKVSFFNVEYSDDSEDYRNVSGDIIELTQEDCPLSTFDCNGTTKITHQFIIQKKINGCVDTPTNEINSFDCGYIIPCDLNSCKLKDTNTCEEKTKIVTTYFCDAKLGCISDEIRTDNSEDCGYLYSGKYTLQDVNKIRILAKQCKFDVTNCIDFDDYKFPKIYMGKSEIGIVNPNTMEETHQKIYLDGYIRTPYVEAIIFAANKEKKYENYTDEDIINYLDLNKFWIIVNPKDSSNGLAIFGYLSYLDNPIGNLQTVIVKYNAETNKGTDVQSETYSKAIYNYSNLFNKEVELIIVGDEREVRTTVDLNKYK